MSTKGQYGRVRLVLNLYIAAAVTILGVLILSSVGTNNTQNRQIAEQARAIAKTNQRNTLTGCQRNNFVRLKINTVSGALTRLLRRSVAENEAKGMEPTPKQTFFLNQLYGELAPLQPVPCQEEYSR